MSHAFFVKFRVFKRGFLQNQSVYRAQIFRDKSETEIGERDWGETLKGRVRLAHLARVILDTYKRFARVICTHSVENVAQDGCRTTARL